MKIFGREYIQRILKWNDWMDTPMKGIRTQSHSKLGLNDATGAYKRKRGQENTLYGDMHRDEGIFYFNGQLLPSFPNAQFAQQHITQGVATEQISFLESQFYQSTAAAVSKALENALNYMPQIYYSDCLSSNFCFYSFKTEYLRKDLNLVANKWIFKVKGKVSTEYTIDGGINRKPMRQLDFDGTAEFDMNLGQADGWGFQLHEMSISDDQTCVDLLQSYLESISKADYITRVENKLLKPLRDFSNQLMPWLKGEASSSASKKLLQLATIKSGKTQVELFKKFTVAEVLALNEGELSQIVRNMWFFLYPAVFNYIIDKIDPTRL